jgi:hypothetical protein
MHAERGVNTRVHDSSVGCSEHLRPPRFKAPLSAACWYRSEARRRWGFSSDGDVYDADDRDSVGSF